MKPISIKGATGVKAPVAMRGNRTFEGFAARKARMEQFWSDKAHQTFYVVGNLLAYVHNGKTLAEYLAAGETVDLGATISLPTDAAYTHFREFPLANGSLSLDNVKEWGCPACHSAHGTARGTSKSEEPNAVALAGNHFLYCPATQRLLTFSATCWEKWSAALIGPKVRDARVKYAPVAKTVNQMPATDAAAVVPAPSAGK